MGFHFDIEKAVQVVAYLLKHEPNRQASIMKLLKLLYIADRESLRDAGFPITGDDPVAMQHGPVLTRIYNLMKTPGDWEEPTREEDLWCQVFKRESGKLLTLLRDPGDDLLSDYERQKLDEVLSKYGSLTAAELRGATHEFPEWRNNEVGGSSVPIPLKDILEAVERAEDFEIIEADAQEDKLIARLLAR
ncbi:MAG: SocA family protein [Candidatus Hydrogenedentes bacterium]|nr:SocA family protein [Candidatus Hydrogenedentota bacterium]